jgi:hypothetical protein
VDLIDYLVTNHSGGKANGDKAKVALEKEMLKWVATKRAGMLVGEEDEECF